MECVNKRLNIIKQHLNSNSNDVVICAALRTPMTKAKKGYLKDTPIEEMLAQLYVKVIEKTGLDPSKIDEVIIGNLLKNGSAGRTLRMSQFMAGFPQSVPCYAVNRLGAAGIQAVNNIAISIQLGDISIGLAGGAENMSMYEIRSSVQRPLPQRLFSIPDAANCYIPMGITSENLARRFDVPRDKMDAFAARSHFNAANAQEKGYFDEEIVPINVQVIENGIKKEMIAYKDDGIRKNTTEESLKKLKPSFDPKGKTTAGNASQMSDGASVILLASRKAAEENNLPILARWVAHVAVGVDPFIMGIGPSVAIPKVLEKAGLSINDIDVFEINEAFASQAYYTVQKLGIDLNKVNPNGGAIALGHPLGSTATRLIVTLLPELRRRRGRYGLVSMCIGSGMGAAAIIENLIR